MLLLPMYEVPLRFSEDRDLATSIKGYVLSLRDPAFDRELNPTHSGGTSKYKTMALPNGRVSQHDEQDIIQRNLTFKKTSAIFNLAARLSIYATSETCSEPYKFCLVSAGILRYLSVRIDGNASSTGLRRDILQTQADIMSAQAQEFYLQSRKFNKSCSEEHIFAELASGGCLLYENVTKRIGIRVRSDIFDHAQFKAKSMLCGMQAEYFQGLAEARLKRYGLAIARLLLAQKLAEDVARELPFQYQNKLIEWSRGVERLIDDYEDVNTGTIPGPSNLEQIRSCILRNHASSILYSTGSDQVGASLHDVLPLVIHLNLRNDLKVILNILNAETSNHERMLPTRLSIGSYDNGEFENIQNKYYEYHGQVEGADLKKTSDWYLEMQRNVEDLHNEALKFVRRRQSDRQSCEEHNSEGQYLE